MRFAVEASPWAMLKLENWNLEIMRCELIDYHSSVVNRCCVPILFMHPLRSAGNTKGALVVAWLRLYAIHRCVSNHAKLCATFRVREANAVLLRTDPLPLEGQRLPFAETLSAA
jgi:hypothetical protein